MKALITGGAGFIGSNLAERLIKEDFQVSIIDNLSSGFLKNVPDKAKFYLADITNKEIINKIFEIEKPDYVFHLAAQIDVRASVREPVFDAYVNIIGGINILEECVRYRIKKIIYINTGGALYGNVAQTDIPVKEDYKINPDCHYGVSKLTFENYLKLYNKLYDLNYVSLRLPNVYGEKQNPYGEAGVVAIFIGKILSGEKAYIYGDGNQTRDYTYVGDVVDGILLSLNKGNNECYNLGTGKEISVNELYAIISDVSGCKGLDPIYAEKRPGEIERIALNAEKAKKELGWEPKTDILDGIRKTYEFFKGTLNK
jgi:UDP-glucose 4-epimerase